MSKVTEQPENTKKTFSTAELLEMLGEQLPQHKGKLDFIKNTIPPAEYNPFEKYPTKPFGSLGLKRSEIPLTEGTQTTIVLDFDTMNIAAIEAIKQGIPKDQFYRDAIWSYCETSIKK